MSIENSSKEKIIITEEDRQKVSSLVEEITKNLGSKMRYSAFFLAKMDGQKKLGDIIGSEKARVIMKEIEKEAKELRDKIPDEEKPTRYKATFLKNLQNKEKEKIDEIKKKLGEKYN
jgi:Rieske Fe-S protein